MLPRVYLSSLPWSPHGVGTPAHAGAAHGSAAHRMRYVNTGR